MKTIHIALAKKKKSKSKPKSNRSAFMKALMTAFAKSEPEVISDAFVNKDLDTFSAKFQKICETLKLQATPKEDEKDQTSVTAKVIRPFIVGRTLPSKLSKETLAFFADGKTPQRALDLVARVKAIEARNK